MYFSVNWSLIMSKICTKEQIKTDIEILRKEMVLVGMKNGFGSPNTIIISQKLDVLIFEYQRLST
jgi:hypothetical protein